MESYLVENRDNFNFSITNALYSTENGVKET
jgi:hypothetical protein